MMTQQHIEEGLSRAYVAAVAARAGVNIGVPLQDYGVDGTFSLVHSRKGRWSETGIRIDFQLKASIHWRIEGDDVVYDLDARAYNDMVIRHSRKGLVPLILILLCLPKESKQWMEQSEERLLMRKCCYWTWLAGSPTPNRRSVIVRVPRRQIFAPEALAAMLDRLDRGEELL